MGIEKLDHYSVRTTDVQRAIKFYEEALHFYSGPRPPFSFPGAWLYTQPHAGEAGSAVVHLIGIDPGAAEYLGDKTVAAKAGTGSLDHIAFSATGITELYSRLQQHGIPFRERKVPNRELHQVFLHDPDGLMIELNYSQPEDIAASHK